jgi:hypothetical protein
MKNQLETVLLGRQWVAGFAIFGFVSLFSTPQPLDDRIRRLRGMQLVRYAA